MTRHALPFIAACFALTASASAQPQQAPARFRAEIMHPPVSHRPHYANMTATRRRGRWVLVGCDSIHRGSCGATRRVVLTREQTRQLDQLLAAVLATSGCEPRPREPGVYRTYELHISREHFGRLSRRQPGACGAPGRLARWLAHRWEEAALR